MFRQFSNCWRTSSTSAGISDCLLSINLSSCLRQTDATSPDQFISRKLTGSTHRQDLPRRTVFAISSFQPPLDTHRRGHRNEWRFAIPITRDKPAIKPEQGERNRQMFHPCTPCVLFID